MQTKIQYKKCSTGLLTEFDTTLADPVLQMRWTSGKYGLAQMEEVFLKQPNSSYPWTQMAMGLYKNMMHGGPFVPHGILGGKESYVFDPIDSTDTEFTPTSHRDAAGNLIWTTDAYYLVTDRRVPEEDLMNWESAPYNGEIIQLGTYVADTNPIDLNGVTAFANDHPMFAVIQPIVPVPASYDLAYGKPGSVYQLERPTQVSTCTGADGGSQTVDITFTKSSDVGISAYMVALLKKGDGYSLYAAPPAIPEWVCPAFYGTQTKVGLWLADGTAVASGGTNLTDNTTTWTAENLDSYFKITTADPGVVTAVQAVVAGTYYAVVWAIANARYASNVLYFTEDTRISLPKISVAITVA